MYAYPYSPIYVEISKSNDETDKSQSANRETLTLYVKNKIETNKLDIIKEIAGIVYSTNPTSHTGLVCNGCQKAWKRYIELGCQTKDNNILNLYSYLYSCIVIYLLIMFYILLSSFTKHTHQRITLQKYPYEREEINQ